MLIRLDDISKLPEENKQQVFMVVDALLPNRPIHEIINAQIPTYEVILMLEQSGNVPFTDAKTPFVNYYNNKLRPLLGNSIIQSYTNHPTEGYFYFLYDADKISRQQAIDTILSI